jgi:hypothetical protein
VDVDVVETDTEVVDVVAVMVFVVDVETVVDLEVVAAALTNPRS